MDNNNLIEVSIARMESNGRRRLWREIMHDLRMKMEDQLGQLGSPDANFILASAENISKKGKKPFLLKYRIVSKPLEKERTEGGSTQKRTGKSGD